MEKERLVRFTLEALAKYDASHHMVFNHIIEVDGTHALCLADVNMMHMLHDDGATRSCLVGSRYRLKLYGHSHRFQGQCTCLAAAEKTNVEMPLVRSLKRTLWRRSSLDEARAEMSANGPTLGNRRH